MKKYFNILLVGCSLAVIGIVLSVYQFSLFSYINHLPQNKFDKEVETVYYTINNKDLHIRLIDNNYYIVKDENLADQVKLSFIYYPSFIVLDKKEVEKVAYRDVTVNFKIANDTGFFYSDLFNTVSNDLKLGKIHNYSLLFQPYVEITINPEQMNRIKIISR